MVFKKGNINWNKGLTKNEDMRLENFSINMKKIILCLIKK